MRNRYFSLLVAAVLCMPTAASSNRFASNPDRIIPRSLNPQFLPLGIVQRMGELEADAKRSEGAPPTAGRATAFYIGPCAVATNYHVAYGLSPNQNPRTNYGLVMHVGFNGEDGFLYESELPPADHGEFNDKEKHDCAILRDPKCLGEKVGWFRAMLASDSELIAGRAPTFLVSFNADRPFGHLSISVGHVSGKNAQSGNLSYDVSAAPGSSGGAVLLFSGGQMALVGINVGGPKEGDRYEFATYTTERANEFKNIYEIPVQSKLFRESMASTIANPADQFFAMKPRSR